MECRPLADETGELHGKEDDPLIRTNLKVFRIKQGLTQDEFAQKVGYSRSYYRRIENGEYSGALKFWQAVSETFSIPMVEVLELMKIDEN